jgi:hypothetical protein
MFVDINTEKNKLKTTIKTYKPRAESEESHTRSLP